MTLAALNLGWQPIRPGTQMGEICRVILTGRPPRAVVPDEQAQRVWRCTSVREARHRGNPWHTVLPGTLRLRAAMVIEAGPTTVDVLHANGHRRVYPIGRVFVPLRVRMADVGECDRWSSVVVEPERSKQ